MVWGIPSGQTAGGEGWWVHSDGGWQTKGSGRRQQRKDKSGWGQWSQSRPGGKQQQALPFKHKEFQQMQQQLSKM